MLAIQRLEGELQTFEREKQERAQEVARLKTELSKSASKTSSKELKALRKKAKVAEKEAKQLKALMAKMEEASSQENTAAKELKTLRGTLSQSIAAEKAREAEVNQLRSDLASKTAESESRIYRLQARVSELEGHLSTPVAQAAPQGKPTAAISEVEFKDYANVSRVQVNFSGDSKYEILEQSADKAILLVRSAHLPERLQRSLDTSEFGSPVSLVSSYRSTVPGEAGAVRVVVNLRNGTPNRVVRVKDGLVWEFERVQSAGGTLKMGPRSVRKPAATPQTREPAQNDTSRLRYYPNMVGQSSTPGSGTQNPYFSRRKKRRSTRGSGSI